MTPKSVKISALLFALPLCACDSGPSPTAQVAATYAEIAEAAYGDAVTGATALRSAIEAFLAAPSQATLDAARAAWVASRPAYLQTEVYRFYEGPIDNAETGPEGSINAWPVDESLLDSVRDGENVSHMGIVNDPALLPTIDPESLAALNQSEPYGEEFVTAGYHPIEFLLWGQDLSSTGPGARPFTDYVDGMNAERRRAYLAAAAELLVADLTSVRDAWVEGRQNYRREFLETAESDPTEALRRILLGMGSLSGAELAGERMNVAYESKSQNDEHSCFSDTTHQDHLNDAIGIENVYLGRYNGPTAVSGPSLSALVASRDAELDATMRSQLSASIAAIRAIPEHFDEAILGDDTAPGRVKIKAAIDALRAQTQTIARIADLFDVTLNLEE